jgi:glycerate-2-kinase
MTLMISDVPGDDPATIGSGPTFPDISTPEQAIAVLHKYGLLDRVPPAILATLRNPPSPRVAMAPERHRHILLADSGTALAAARAAAVERGYRVEVVDAHLTGDTHAAARRFATAMRAAERPSVLLAAGETTLKVSGRGRGGRNQEFALIATHALEGVAGATLLASGTDGTDGPTDAAGAFADGRTLTRARAQGLDPGAMLADNDSHRFFAALGDLHITGPTGTNVMDLVVGVVE